MIGVITSALGPARDYVESLDRARKAGFETVQITWLDNALKVYGPVQLAQDISASSRQLRINSLCMADIPKIGWISYAFDYIALARMLKIPIVSQHLPDNPSALGIFNSIVRRAEEQGIAYSIETGNETDLQAIANVAPLTYDTGNRLAIGLNNQQIA